MNVLGLIFFVLVFLGVSIAVPFLLSMFLPAIAVMLGTLGVQAVTGVVLYIVLLKMSGSKA